MSTEDDSPCATEDKEAFPPTTFAQIELASHLYTNAQSIVNQSFVNNANEPLHISYMPPFTKLIKAAKSTKFLAKDLEKAFQQTSNQIWHHHRVLFHVLRLMLGDKIADEWNQYGPDTCVIYLAYLAKSYPQVDKFLMEARDNNECAVHKLGGYLKEHQPSDQTTDK